MVCRLVNILRNCCVIWSSVISCVLGEYVNQWSVLNTCACLQNISHTADLILTNQYHRIPDTMDYKVGHFYNIGASFEQ